MELGVNRNFMENGKRRESADGYMNDERNDKWKTWKESSGREREEQSETWKMNVSE